MKKSSVKRRVTESKEIFILKSLFEDIKKCLIEQKNLIDKLPEKINSGFDIEGVINCFNFIGKEEWRILFRSLLLI